MPTTFDRLALVWRPPLRARILAGAASALLACSSAPRPKLGGEIPLDVRVRVIAHDLPSGWHPGRLIHSAERCRVVTVATSRRPDPIVVLNMGQISRLQISTATPPPEWWTEPGDREGWMDIEVGRLREESESCRRHYPPLAARAKVRTIDEYLAVLAGCPCAEAGQGRDRGETLDGTRQPRC